MKNHNSLFLLVFGCLMLALMLFFGAVSFTATQPSVKHTAENWFLGTLFPLAIISIVAVWRALAPKR